MKKKAVALILKTDVSLCTVSYYTFSIGKTVKCQHKDNFIFFDNYQYLVTELKHAPVSRLLYKI